MDRHRLINEIQVKGIPVKNSTLNVVKELGRGGNGVAFLCENENNRSVVAKVYIPPDNRDLDEQSFKRFEREISLSAKFSHPNVIRALDSGVVQIGAYSLPFYLMPFAHETLRNRISQNFDSFTLERLFRIFLRTSLGAAFLHSQGVTHRDIKPENILLDKNGTPWIADLGIAHVNPNFVSAGLKTIASEQLLNRDYYAPEQRFGNNSEVDHRADIYALGCILYELISGTPPVRKDCPKLESFSKAFAPLDPIVDRMTAYKATNRYPNLEDAIEDLSMNFGTVLSVLKTGYTATKSDLQTMVKLLKHQNVAQQERGIQIARELGDESLESLYELLGHTRRDIRNAAAIALGEIGNPSSLPFLVGALYGNTTDVRRFRPLADTAATAISRYPLSDRIKAISQISQPVALLQLQLILKGVSSSSQACSAVISLARRRLILRQWHDTDLYEIIIHLDEEQAWEDIITRIERKEYLNIRNIITYLSVQRRMEIINLWLEKGTIESWDFRFWLETILGTDTPLEARPALLEKLKMRIAKYPTYVEHRDLILKRIAEAIATAVVANTPK